MNKALKIGIIGAGRIGRLHAENLVASVSEAKVTAIADPFMTGQTQAWASSLDIACFRDASEVMGNPEIDAVFICSSTNTHADYIMGAAKNGKHVFCEKPIDFDLKKTKKALDIVEKSGVKLQLGFVRRFDHNHKKVRDTVASGMLGKPHVIRITSRDPEPPPFAYARVSGGLFMDMMIHDFDMARYLSGSEVLEVMAYGDALISPKLKEIDDIDVATVMIKFENGAFGIIDNSRKASYGYDQRTEVHCESGCVRTENDLINCASISTAQGVMCEKPTWFFLERYNDAFIAEERAFINSVIDNKEISVSGIDGIKSVLIAMAAKESLKRNRPVSISEIEI